VDKIKFTKVILINISAAFIYGIMICIIFMVIFYVLSGVGPGSIEGGFARGLYLAARLGLIVGIIAGLIFAIILGMLLRPFKRVVYIKDENIFLSVLNIAISGINYELEKRDDNLYIFKEKKDRLAKILVRIKENNAVIYGHFNKVVFLSKYFSGRF